MSAALLVVGATMCFASLDTIIKFLSQHYAVLLLVWARWTAQAIALVAWLGRDDPLRLVRTSRPGMQLLRGALLTGSSICFMTALKYLPLADTTALNYSTPMMVSVMAVLFLNERMTGARIAFILAGIAGMLLIVRPGSNMFQGAAVFGLCSAGFYAMFQILTRLLAGDDWRVTMFFPSLVATVTMSFVVPFLDWPAAIPWQHVALLVAGCLLGTYGHYLFLRAFQLGTASAVTPFTYMQLVWATLVGWLVFGTFPDRWTLAGMVVIAASGLLIMLYERRLAAARHRRAPESPEPATVD
jgi:drug/metabolite transporter (DMT)-like permease